MSKRLRNAHKSLLAAVVDREGFSAKIGAKSSRTIYTVLFMFNLAAVNKFAKQEGKV